MSQVCANPRYPGPGIVGSAVSGGVQFRVSRSLNPGYGTGSMAAPVWKLVAQNHDRHLLAVCRYIDLNPVRAGIVAHPIDYRSSSFAGLIGQRDDPLVTPHPVLTQLGDPPGPGYARWCGETVDDDELARLRDATNHELAFGDDRFKAQIEAATSRRTSAMPRGRGAAGRRGQLNAG